MFCFGPGKLHIPQLYVQSTRIAVRPETTDVRARRCSTPFFSVLSTLSEITYIIYIYINI